MPIRHNKSLLLVDDEPLWLRALSRTLQRSGGFADIIECQDSRQVLGILAERPVSLILLDLTMPHLPGDELLPLLVEQYPEIPVIVNTALNQVETAVQCMQLGAFDFLVKTSEEGPLLAGIHRALRFLELQGENRALQQQVLNEELRNPEAFSRIHTQNPRMLALFRYLEAVAPSGQPVLITGESGAGKELLARAVHLLSRQEEPWVPVNVAGLDDNVFSDTLFGHVRGAFTGADQPRPGMIEQAAGGTLFLDEIGDLSPLSQVKLLRLLQEGEYLPLGSDKPKRCRARIVVATNQDLELLQKQGRFRKDLYYRLRGHHAQVPALRQRRDDLPLLLECFLTEAAEELGKKHPTPPPELLTLLGSYHFPGNVRELRAMVYDALSLHESGKLSMAAFKKAMGESNGRAEMPDAEETAAATTCSFPAKLPSIEEAVSQLVDEAMRRAQGNQGIAAGMLGISRQALSKRLKKNTTSS
ncbi:MAG: sigma-54 dependent transcriptional regulator [Desulfuromonadales bacterium]|nr:sigma-54 dependent transcriptional regulator [Desulfuromonadales bacterium]MDW7757203.1 sigma-54 dependent transcriptional regulator [Desulfuromonadales bacterium]